jgi:hypothetical protein
MTPPKGSAEGLPVSARSENMRATSGHLVHYVISGILASVFDLIRIGACINAAWPKSQLSESILS